jgi:hypothetical protein
MSPLRFTTDRIDWGSECGSYHIKPSHIRALRKATSLGSSKDGGSKIGRSVSWAGYGRSASMGLRMSSNLAAVTMSSSSIIADINNLVYTSNTNDDDEFDAAGKARLKKTTSEVAVQWPSSG